MAILNPIHCGRRNWKLNTKVQSISKLNTSNLRLVYFVVSGALTQLETAIDFNNFCGHYSCLILAWVVALHSVAIRQSTGKKAVDTISVVIFFHPPLVLSLPHTNSLLLRDVFLGARAPLELAHVKNKNKRRKKFQIALFCFYLHLSTWHLIEIVRNSQR